MKTATFKTLTLTLAAMAISTIGLMSAAQASPGDLLDQALHQSMREHAAAQSEVELTGTTRHEDQAATPSVENSGLKLQVGLGEIRPDIRPDIRPATFETTHVADTKAPTRISLGNNEPERQAANATLRDGASADEELADPVNAELAPVSAN